MNTDQSWLLSLGTFLPLAGVVLMLFVPKKDEVTAKGIGLATIEKNRDRIVVSGAAAPAPARKVAAKPAPAARSGAAR